MPGKEKSKYYFVARSAITGRFANIVHARKHPARYVIERRVRDA